MVKIIHKDAASHTPSELTPLASRFTLNTIIETSMGVKMDDLDKGDEYRSQLYGLGGIVLERFLKPWWHSPKTYRLSLLSREMDKILGSVHEFTRNVIKKRRQTNHLSTPTTGQLDDDNM